MNIKGNKKYIIAGSMFVAGLLIFIVGFASVGFDLARISTESAYIEKEFTELEEVTQIQVSTQNHAVEFVSTKEEQLHIRYFENEENTFLIENNGGHLRIEMKNNLKWYNRFFMFDLNSQDKKMVISVPESFKGEIDVKNSNGDIDFFSVQMQKMTVRNSNGKIVVSGLSITEELDAKTSNSSIRIENIQIGGNMKLTNSNGEITLRDADIDGKSIYKTSNSSINLVDLSGENFDLQTNNGKISLENITAQREILAKTSNSSIFLDHVDVEESISCTNSNGSIKGTIVGAMQDFSITSHTSNGNNNLPSDTNKGEKKAHFKTSNSSIQVNFTK